MVEFKYKFTEEPVIEKLKYKFPTLKRQDSLADHVDYSEEEKSDHRKEQNLDYLICPLAGI